MLASGARPSERWPASRGIVFLDEIGELAKSVQVKLQWTLREGKILAVGSSRSRRVAVRVIAATNHSLLAKVTAGAFPEAFLRLPGAEQDGILGRPLGKGLDLPGLLATVARHYLKRALDEAAGNKTRAVKLVGFSSYRALPNRVKRYGVTA